jgi:hypothetical protein
VAAGTRLSQTEVAVDERDPILRAFLHQVPGGVQFFDGRTPDDVVANAARYPVFRVSATGAGDAAASQV